MKRISKRALTLTVGAVLAGALAPAVTASAATAASPATARAITVIPLTPARPSIRGVTAAPASGVTLDSNSGNTVQFTLCGVGNNYKSYLKIIQDGAFLRTPFVTPGECVEFSTTFPNTDPVTVYDFGIYNISQQGFDVNTSGAPVFTSGPGDIIPPFTIESEGTTTAPFGVSIIAGVTRTF